MLPNAESLLKAVSDFVVKLKGMTCGAGVGAHDASPVMLAKNVSTLKAANADFQVVELLNDAVYETVPEALRVGKTLVLISTVEPSGNTQRLARTISEGQTEWAWGETRVTPVEGQRLVFVVPGTQGLTDVPTSLQSLPYWTFV